MALSDYGVVKGFNPLGAKVGYIRPIYKKFGTLGVNWNLAAVN